MGICGEDYLGSCGRIVIRKQSLAMFPYFGSDATTSSLPLEGRFVNLLQVSKAGNKTAGFGSNLVLVLTGCVS